MFCAELIVKTFQVLIVELGFKETELHLSICELSACLKSEGFLFDHKTIKMS